ncbi:MAG: AAA family ATPase [Bacteroidota bacterium]
MRITNINIPQELINNGLKPVKMKRLNQVVLLAGQNGAGKTRLLNLIANTISSKPKKSQIDILESEIDKYEKAIGRQERQIEAYQKSLETETRPANIKTAEQQIDQCKKNIESYKGQLDSYDKIGKWNHIETNELSERYTIIPFVPKSLDLKDANIFNRNTLLSNADKVNTVGVGSLSEGTFARIQVIQDRWHNATHQDSKHPKDTIQEAATEYENLKDLIKTFLNAELERNLNGEPTLFGFSLGRSNLSDGQKVLLQLCLAIHCQDEKLENLILFLDEPENHLHPSVLIQTIERVLTKIPNGQLWISTHSIPLLSYFDPSNIWYVEQNKVSYAGSGPEKVLKSLVGDESRISKLQDFISLPGQFALNRHAFESLL